MQQYDLIVIGGGPGGAEAAAIGAAQGLSVALIENRQLGGTCLNRGCVPTKCLCAAAERILEIKGSGEFGIAVDGFSADFSAAHQRAERIVGELREDVASKLSGVDVINGSARLGEARTVATESGFLKGRRIIIATGSKPITLPIEGAELMLDSDAFLQLDTLPESLTVIGGGVIGLEFASVAAAYGCKVTVVERCREILPGMDAEVAKRLRSYLSRRGVAFIVGATVHSVKRTDSGSLLVSYEAKGKEGSVESVAVLGAPGRRACLPEGLEAAGVSLNPRGFIDVDDSYRTSAEGVYAIGDVTAVACSPMPPRPRRG